MLHCSALLYNWMLWGWQVLTYHCTCHAGRWVVDVSAQAQPEACWHWSPDPVCTAAFSSVSDGHSVCWQELFCFCQHYHQDCHHPLPNHYHCPTAASTKFACKCWAHCTTAGNSSCQKAASIECQMLCQWPGKSAYGQSLQAGIEICTAQLNACAKSPKHTPRLGGSRDSDVRGRTGNYKWPLVEQHTWSALPAALLPADALAAFKAVFACSIETDDCLFCRPVQIFSC